MGSLFPTTQVISTGPLHLPYWHLRGRLLLSQGCRGLAGTRNIHTRAVVSTTRFSGVRSMRVVELQNTFGIDSLTVIERPEPRPSAGQVLLKMKAFSLNFRDLMVVKGIYNPKLRLPL